METTMNNDMCRCCATVGTFKDIKTKYHWMGEEEIYADMLKDYLDITLAAVDGESNGICEVCITQLRNAANFKKQVQHTEQRFQRHLQDKIFAQNIVKEEASGDEDVDSDNMGDDFVPDYDVSIKSETEDKPKKRTTRASTSKNKIITLDGGESSKKRTKKKWNVKEECGEDNIVEKNLPEMKKQWHNLMTLLKHSNATPFKDKNDAGFVCAYCYKSFPEVSELRFHTHKDHAKEQPTYRVGSGLSSFVAFIDIVDLKCTICEVSIEDLSALTNHLVADHQMQFFEGLTDYFQPFKLTNDKRMCCCLCDEAYHNMKLLMQHMNVHYRNFICTTCGAGFVNSFRLNRHETTHEKKKASYNCSHCGESFANESKKKAHINTEHKGKTGDSVCQLCKARFKNYYQKMRHMIQVHNVEGIKCDMCDKRFNLKSNLMVHMRSVHLKERPFECSVCSMGFFVKRHMVGHYLATHTNERKFKCEVCGKAYATQNSKRKHMKKIHGISKSSMPK